MLKHSQNNQLIWFFCITVLCAACARTPPAIQPTTASPVSTLTVFAAASLQSAFKQIGKDFEAQNPGVTVAFNFAGSQQLAEQINQGAPADVFASANTQLMDAVIQRGHVTTRTQQVFARNRLVLVLPKSNPAGIKTLQDLAKPGLKLVLAAQSVPAGQYASDFLAKASKKAEFGATFSQTVLANVVSYEVDVRSVFAKVALGEADAGIVYRSDLAADKQATVLLIDIPDDLNVVANYPITVIQNSPQHERAQRFVDFVLSPDGQHRLTELGFLPAR